MTTLELVFDTLQRAAISRKLSIDPDRALQQANAKFSRRFEQVQRLAHDRGLDLGRASLAELDELWDETKAGEGGDRRS